MTKANEESQINEIKRKMKEAKKARETKENALQYLIGRKVNLIVTEHEYGKGEDKMKYKQYKVDDTEFEKEIDSIASQNRIFPPGTMGTMDYKMFRLNVYINEEGIVTRVSYG